MAYRDKIGAGGRTFKEKEVQVEQAQDAANEWVALNDYTTGNQVFSFAPTQTTARDFQGNLLVQGQRYFGEYDTPQAAGATLTIAEIAKIKTVADPSLPVSAEALTNKVASIRDAATSTDTEYPTERAVRTELDLKHSVSDIVTVIRDAATSEDTKTVSEKAIRTALDSLPSNFLANTDTFNAFTGLALQVLRVNAAEDAVEAIQLAASLVAYDNTTATITGNPTTTQAAIDALKALIDAQPLQTSVAAFGDLPDPTTVTDGAIVHVIDASADTTVTSGWAKYQEIGDVWFKYLAQEDLSVISLTQTQVESTSGGDYQIQGTISAERLDQWGMSRRVQRIFNVNANFDFRALGYAPRTAVFIRNIDNANGVNITFGVGGSHTIVGTRADGTAITGTDFFNLQPSEFLVMEDDMDGVTVRASIIPAERVKVFTNYAIANAFGALPHDGIVLIQDTEEVWARKSAVNGVLFPADGVENADWGIFGGKNNFVQTGTTAEKIALGIVPSSTPFFDTDLGKLQYYKTSSDVFTVNKAATDLPYLVEWASANSVFSNMQFKITTSATETTDNSVINLPDGEDVLLYIIGRQFFNGAQAANTLGGAFTVRNDNGTLTLVSIEPNRYWGGGLDYTTMSYTDFPNLVTSPIGISISDVNAIFTNIASAGIWTNLDGTLTQSQSLEDFKPLTGYATGERFVAPMPLNANFIDTNGAIYNVDYIFEANADIPDTVAAFDEAQADSGNYDLVGVFRVSGTQDRVLTGTGTIILDPIGDLSNTALNEYIHWTTTDTPKTIRLVPAPAFVTIWKDYTGTNTPQPTAANEDFVLPADSQIWVHRSGNNVYITFESNEGGSSLTVSYPGDNGIPEVNKDNVYYLDETVGALPSAESEQEISISIVQANSTDTQIIKDAAKAKVTHYRSFDTGAGFIWIESESTIEAPPEVELISRSGSNNPGNGNPFQHSNEHGNQGSITYAAGIYTIGLGGLYDIDASLNLANGTSAGNVSAQVFINGIAEGPIALISNDGVANFPGSGAVLISIQLAAGDTVEFRQLTTPGFNVNKSTSMRIATRGGLRGADGVNGTDGADGAPGLAGADGIDGAAGVNGADGVDGISIDHINLTSGTSAPATTDTYTAWGDVAETINLGTFDVPIPAATPNNFTQVGTALSATSDKHYVLQHNGTEIVNTLAYEYEKTGDFEFSCNHLTGELIQRQDEPSASGGTVTFVYAFNTTPKITATSTQNAGHTISVITKSATQFTFDQWDVNNTQQNGTWNWMGIGLKP